MKGSNLGVMPENPKKNEGIESRRNARKPEIKGRDNIRARCRRTRNKSKGKNPITILENPKQNEWIEFGPDAGEPETKLRDRTHA